MSTRSLSNSYALKGESTLQKDAAGVFIKDLAGIYAEGSGIDLSGTREALRKLVALITGRQTKTVQVHFDPAATDTRIYPIGLKRMVVEEDDTIPAMTIKVIDDLLAIRGSNEAIEILTYNIGFVAETTGPRGYHIHIEYYPSYSYLDETAEPMVVSLKQEDRA